jgi:hypothetical protein
MGSAESPAQAGQSRKGPRMALDTDKIDDAVLALLFLTRHDQWRAWKGFDWDALSRLHRKGMIADPVNKAKSVEFTEEGLRPRPQAPDRAIRLAPPYRGDLVFGNTLQARPLRRNRRFSATLPPATSPMQRPNTGPELSWRPCYDAVPRARSLPC